MKLTDWILEVLSFQMRCSISLWQVSLWPVARLPQRFPTFLHRLDKFDFTCIFSSFLTRGTHSTISNLSHPLSNSKFQNICVKDLFCGGFWRRLTSAQPLYVWITALCAFYTVLNGIRRAPYSIICEVSGETAAGRNDAVWLMTCHRHPPQRSVQEMESRFFTYIFLFFFFFFLQWLFYAEGPGTQTQHNLGAVTTETLERWLTGGW